MSSNAVSHELRSFLNSHNPGVFVVRGSWGVGKTHLLDEVVKENRLSWEGRNYAYVSLFGTDSLEELRENIFVGTEATKRCKNMWDFCSQSLYT